MTRIPPIASADAYASKVKIVGKVDDFVVSRLDAFDGVIENAAKLYNIKSVKIAQRKGVDPKTGKKTSTMLINSGAKTSTIRLDKMERANDFINGIIDNMRTNSKAAGQKMDMYV